MDKITTPLSHITTGQLAVGFVILSILIIAVGLMMGDDGDDRDDDDDEDDEPGSY